MRHVELGTPQKDHALVDEASYESFPASDPPAWTATHAGLPRPEPIVPETPADLRQRLRKDIDILARDVTTHREAAEHITTRFLDSGRHVVRIPVKPGAKEENLEGIARGTTAKETEDVIVGARYGTADPTGVAVLLSLAHLLSGRRFERTVRLVAFADVDRYVRRLVDNGVRLRAAIALDTVGFCSARQDRPWLPFPLSRIMKPWEGEFVAFVANGTSRALGEEVASAFRNGTDLEARTRSVSSLFGLVRSSAHRPFARAGYPAVMVTDAGPYRSCPQHTGRDLPDHLNYDHMADLAFGLASAVVRLARREEGA